MCVYHLHIYRSYCSFYRHHLTKSSDSSLNKASPCHCLLVDEEIKDVDRLRVSSMTMQQQLTELGLGPGLPPEWMILPT